MLTIAIDVAGKSSGVQEKLKVTLTESPIVGYGLLTSDGFETSLFDSSTESPFPECVPFPELPRYILSLSKSVKKFHELTRQIFGRNYSPNSKPKKLDVRGFLEDDANGKFFRCNRSKGPLEIDNIAREHQLLRSISDINADSEGTPSDFEGLKFLEVFDINNPRVRAAWLDPRVVTEKHLPRNVRIPAYPTALQRLVADLLRTARTIIVDFTTEDALMRLYPIILRHKVPWAKSNEDGLENPQKNKCEMRMKGTSKKFKGSGASKI